MGWFDEQIRQRKAADNDALSEAFDKMTGAVLGRKIMDGLDDSKVTKNAIDEILKYFRVKTQEVPPNIKILDEQLEFLMRPHGIMRRTVYLKEGWYKDATGAMLGVRKSDGKVVALLPAGMSGYTYLNYETGKRVHITRKNEGEFEEEALVFYRPFSLKKMGLADLLRYMVEVLSAADYMLLALATLIVTVIGMLTPYLNHIFFSDVPETAYNCSVRSDDACTLTSRRLFQVLQFGRFGTPCTVCGRDMFCPCLNGFADRADNCPLTAVSGTDFQICTLFDCPRTADIAAYTACLPEFRCTADKSQP